MVVLIRVSRSFIALLRSQLSNGQQTHSGITYIWHDCWFFLSNWLSSKLTLCQMCSPAGRTVVTELRAGVDHTASHHSRSRLHGLPEAPAAAWGQRRPGTRRLHRPARVLRELPVGVYQAAAHARRWCQCRLWRGTYAFALLHKPRIPGVSKSEVHEMIHLMQRFLTKGFPEGT